MTVSISVLLIAICVSLVCGAGAFFGFRRARKMKTRAVRAEAKTMAYRERLEARSIAEAKLRAELAESREFRTKLKEVKTDEEATAAVDDFFARVEQL